MLPGIFASQVISEHTERGGEGMVVKPLNFIQRGRRGIVQPTVKCRGREYLRIIYAPDCTIAANLDRLRSRGAGRKRSFATREFAPGVEALERFVRNEPFRRVHGMRFWRSRDGNRTCRSAPVNFPTVTY